MNKPNEFEDLKTVHDLQLMQLTVKARIKDRERELAERWRKLPSETLKAATGAIMPAVLNRRFAATALLVLKTVGGLIFKSRSRPSSIKDTLLSSAKQFGLTTLLRTAVNFFTKKAQK